MFIIQNMLQFVRFFISFDNVINRGNAGEELSKYFSKDTVIVLIQVASHYIGYVFYREVFVLFLT